MTVLGKMLAIFVLLFSLVWCGLVVSGHVTRTNWKNEAMDYRKKAQEAAAAAAESTAKLDEALKAHSGQLANLANDKKTLENRIAALEKTQQDWVNSHQQLMTQNRKMAADNDLALANLTQAGKQNEILFDKSAKVEKERDDAVAAKQVADSAALAIKLEAEGIKKQNELFQNKLIAQGEKLRDLQTGANKPGAARVVPVPESIRGTVEKVSGEFVTVSVGSDAEIREGAVLDVVRYGTTPVYLGTLTITQTSLKQSVGTFESKDGPNAKGDALPKTGDTVLKIPTSR